VFMFYLDKVREEREHLESRDDVTDEILLKNSHATQLLEVIRNVAVREGTSILFIASLLVLF
jgi:hypothetical protein